MKKVNVRFDDLFLSTARFDIDLLTSIYELLLETTKMHLVLIIPKNTTKHAQIILKRFRMSNLFDQLKEE